MGRHSAFQHGQNPGDHIFEIFEPPVSGIPSVIAGFVVSCSWSWFSNSLIGGANCFRAHDCLGHTTKYQLINIICLHSIVVGNNHQILQR